MLPRIYGEIAKAGAGGRPTERARQSNLICREALHTLGWRLYPELVRLLPTDVDEQVGVRGARLDYDRAQMPLNHPLSLYSSL